ncbi:MAG: acetolactate decarboxylase [bacterium]
MKIKLIFLLLVCSLFIFVNCTKEVKERIKPEILDDEMVQYSTKQNFLDRNYEGILAIKKLGAYGDFGLGTFNGLDGEMVYLDNVCYQIKANGNVNVASSEEHAPYSTIKHFKIDKSATIGNVDSLSEFFEKIKACIKDTNQFAAVKIEGKFSYLKTRSIHKQNKPFPSLEEVVANQVVSEFKDIEGTLVGFYFPKLYDKINFTEFHFHFISKDKKKGGHLLDCKVTNALAVFDFTKELRIIL